MSPTLQVGKQAKTLQKQGHDVVDFSLGEPDFPTPDNVKQAGIMAINSNFTVYTENDGTPDLKAAIIDRMKADHNISYEPSEILVSCGAKHSLYNLFTVIVDEGDEVIIPAPYWVSYPQMVNILGGKSVVIPTTEATGFKMSRSQLESRLSPKTKAIILNNPSNPTGAAYTAEDLLPIATLCAERGILIVADEIYEKILYDHFVFTSVASLGEKIKKVTVLINGVSKAYSMTGWRIGYAAGPKDIIAAMSKVQSHSTSNACSISQKASIEALRGPQNHLIERNQEFQKRRNYLLERLAAMPGISCFKPQGAFYLFPNVKHYLRSRYQGTEIKSSIDLCMYLLNSAHVALVPGEAFDAADNLRISYATSMENLKKGMDRMAEALAKLEV
jgi:aspartate/methionine/tyrosine aminotransferase